MACTNLNETDLVERSVGDFRGILIFSLRLKILSSSLDCQDFFRGILLIFINVFF